MYITRVPNRGSPPAVLLRESYRDGGKVKNRTLANLSSWPEDKVKALARALKGLPPAGPVRGYASGKEDYLRRLRKIEGQVRGLEKMTEADTWCPDVVIQVASATRALQEVAVGLLNDHLRTCVSAAARNSPADGDARLAKVAATIRQVVRL
jgi:DNA-binding FrmR family transcriptional regulator